MIELTAPHAAAIAARSAVGVRVPATGLFALSLAGFLDGGPTDAAPVAAKDQRQEPAARGSELPADEDQGDASDALAWLVVVPPAPLPPPAAPATLPFLSSEVEKRDPNVAQRVSTSACPEHLPWQVVEGLDTNGGGGNGPAQGTPPALAGKLGSLQPPVSPLQPAGQAETALAARGGAPAILAPVSPTRPDARGSDDRAAAMTPALVRPALQPPVQPLQPTPAGEVFAAALHRIADDIRPVSPRARDDDTALPQPVAAADPVRHAVAATGDTQQAPLDMGQRHWPQAMIDRIETLRDQADAADTRFRVVPDALGTIDVALRREGDTVHVRFNADQADTRAMLADAQPRLAELAEARGIRIGDTAVGSGSDSADRQTAPAWQPPQPTRPAAVTLAPDDSLSTDLRIA